MFLLILGLMLITAKILGEITERLGITSIVGEVLAGILLVPVLGLFSMEGIMFDEIVKIGIIFILFIAGLGVRFEDFKKDIYRSSALALCCSVVSFILGFLVGYFILDSFLSGLAIGIILLTTSNSIVFTLLRKIGELKSHVGRSIVSATIADDIIGILALSFFTFFLVHNNVAFNDLFELFLIAAGFYLIILTAGSKIMNKIIDLLGNMIDEQILFSIPLGIIFILAVISENIGLGVATGAFLGGMAIANNRFIDTVIMPKVKVISDGFIIPLFYAFAGAMISLSGINLLFILLILAIASIGNYNIIVAQIAFSFGVITQGVYTSLICAIILTIIITPILLKLFR